MKNQVLVIVYVVVSFSISLAVGIPDKHPKRQFGLLLEGLAPLFGELLAGAGEAAAVGAGEAAAVGAGEAAAVDALATGVDTAVGASTLINAPQQPNGLACEKAGFCIDNNDDCDVRQNINLGTTSMCRSGRKCCLPTGACGRIPNSGDCRLVCHDDEKTSSLLTCSVGFTCCVDKNSNLCTYKKALRK